MREKLSKSDLSIREVFEMSGITESHVMELAEIAMASRRAYRQEWEQLRAKVVELEIEIQKLKAANQQLALEKYQADAMCDILTRSLKRLARREE